MNILVKLLINLLMATLLAKSIFGNFENFRKAISYILMPDIISIANKDFHNDLKHTHKMLLWLISVALMLVFEIKMLIIHLE